MSRLCRFFLILIAACTVAGCGEPVGSIVTTDLLWAETSQPEYNAGYTFMPNIDLEVWTASGGRVIAVSLREVTIKIAEPPSYRPEDMQDVTLEKGYKLKEEKTNLIIVEYDGMSAISPIEVLPAKNNTTSGIDIEWDLTP